MKKKTCVIVPLCLLLSIICVLNSAAQDDIVSYTKVGQKMPAFSVTDTDGKKIATDDLKGKIVLINFWATWCGPCYAELPRLEIDIWRKYKSDDFVMLAIARGQTDREIISYRDKIGFTFPMAADPKREVYRLFGNGGIPRSYVVGVDGNILFQSVGYDDGEVDKMKKIIETEVKNLQKSKKK